MNLNVSSDGTICPMVAVRSMGLAFDSIIGYESVEGTATSLVDEEHLAMLVQIANSRFKTNSERIQRFRASLSKESSPGYVKSERPDWEDASERKKRMKMEGLAKQSTLKEHEDDTMADVLDDFNFNPNSFVA
jgi:tRNA wybutosine-synthesizing protein 3